MWRHISRMSHGVTCHILECASPLSSGLLPTVKGIITYLTDPLTMVISQGSKPPLTCHLPTRVIIVGIARYAFIDQKLYHVSLQMFLSQSSTIAAAKPAVLIPSVLVITMNNQALPAPVAAHELQFTSPGSHQPVKANHSKHFAAGYPLRLRILFMSRISKTGQDWGAGYIPECHGAVGDCP